MSCSVYRSRDSKHGKIRVIRQHKDNAEITAFAGEIRQAFSNLLSNAIDAMPSGGSLVIRTSETRKWSNSFQPGLRVTILDTGTGIPLHAGKSLFEPFFTTDAIFDFLDTDGLASKGYAEIDLFRSEER